MKGGSKEESACVLANYIACEVEKLKSFSHDVILDDRSSVTIGKKLMEAKRVGYPYIIVVGKKSMEQVPLVEVHDLTRNTQHLFTVAEVFNFLQQPENNVFNS